MSEINNHPAQIIDMRKKKPTQVVVNPEQSTNLEKDDTDSKSLQTSSTVSTKDDNKDIVKSINIIKPIRRHQNNLNNNSLPVILPKTSSSDHTKSATLDESDKNQNKIIQLDSEGIELLINTIVENLSIILSANFVSKEEVSSIVEKTLQDMIVKK